MNVNKSKELMIYIHIPFCVRKCNYCDFLSAPAGEDTQDAYMEALCREIQQKSSLYREYVVTSVFIGGGTPTAVKASWIEKLMRILKESYALDAEAEISMEVNPATVGREELLQYKDAGINRLSIGLQSADDKELKRLGRIHTYEQFLETYAQVRVAGFENVNVDLMSGLPDQSPESFQNTLMKVLNLSFPPEHISAYSLIVEEGTPFYKDYEEDKLELPTEEQEREMYHLTKKLLAEYGYERYEISNYAKQGKECRHNAGYWQRKNYVGFGIGAASLVENERFSNGRDIMAYLKNPCEYIMERQKLTVSEQMEETMFLGLRMTEGVNADLWEKRFGVGLESVYGTVIAEHVDNGLLEWTGQGARRFLCLTEKGMDVSNYVMADFLEPEMP